MVDHSPEAMRDAAWVEYQREHGYLTFPTQPDTGADFAAGWEAARGVRLQANWEAVERVIAERLSWASRHWDVRSPDMRQAITDAIFASGVISEAPKQDELTLAEPLPEDMTEHWRGPDYVDGWNAALQHVDDLIVRDRPMEREPMPCVHADCEKNVTDEALFRVNPKGEPGVFMCREHAAAVNVWDARSEAPKPGKEGVTDVSRDG